MALSIYTGLHSINVLILTTDLNYSITSLIRTPTDGQNLFALSGVCINRSNVH